MKLYRLLSGSALLKSYSSKFMFVAFLGIHIPLLGIVAVLFLTNEPELSKTFLFLLTLGLTLLATAVTLAILHSLTAPLRQTQKQLAGYLATATLPSIPTDLTDETGLLMRDVSSLIHRQQTLSSALKEQSGQIITAVNAIETEVKSDTIALHTKTITSAVNKQLQLMDDVYQSGHLHKV